MASRLVLALTLALACPVVAWACSYGGPPSIWGVLGFQGVADEGDVVPANAASVDLDLDLVDPGSELFPVEGLQLWRIRDDLSSIPIGGLDVPVSDTADTTPPSRPVIDDARLEISEPTGDCQSDCSDTLRRYVIDVTATDDVARADRLTYLVHVRRSATYGGPSIQAITIPDDLADGSVWLWADASDEGSERWVWVRAVDQAGNVSELSEPFPIDTGGSGGCALSGRPRRGGLVLPLLFALLMLRRRARAR